MNTFLRMYPGDGCAVLIANLLVQVTVVILAAWLLGRLGSRWNAAWRHTVFFAALVCVLASPALSWVMQKNGIALVTLRPPAQTARSVEPTHVPVARVPESTLVETPAAQLATAQPVNLEARNLAQNLRAETPAPHSLSNILRAFVGVALLIWLLGTALLLARWCHGLYLIARLRRTAKPLDGNTMMELLCQVRQAVRADQLPPIATSVGLDRPIMVGLIRPLVILPEDALRTLHEPQLTDILVHECAHAVCRHHVVALLQRVAGVLFWFHPLVHILNRELARAREEVCDNYVLRRSDGHRYARTLLELSQLLMDISSKPATLGLFHCRWRLEDRVADLLDRRRRVMIRLNRWTAAALIAAFLLLGLSIAGIRVVQAAPDADMAASVGVKTIEKTAEKTFTGDDAEVLCVAFSPDGKTLASGSGSEVNLWDVASGKNLAKLNGFNSAVVFVTSSIAFSPDGRTLASGSSDEVRLWDVAARKRIVSFSENNIGNCHSVIFSPNGKFLIASGIPGDTIRLCDVTNGKITAIFNGRNKLAWYLALSPDGKTLAAAGGSTIELWNMVSRKNTATFNVFPACLYSVAFSPDGKHLATGASTIGASDNTVKLWDVATGKNTAVFNGHTDVIHAVAFSPDGKTLASGSQDNTIRLWDVAAVKETAMLNGHARTVSSVAFSPDGNTLASGSYDKTIKLWNVNKNAKRTDDGGVVQGEQERPKSYTALDSVYAKLQPLFKEYYPTAQCLNSGHDGLRFEHNVTTYEFPYTGPKEKKHEATTQRGPKKGGILCSVYLEKGPYRGQLSLIPRGNHQYEPMTLDKHEFKQLLMAPYSAKDDLHLWVSIAYPSDTSPEFLKRFLTITRTFENEPDSRDDAHKPILGAMEKQQLPREAKIMRDENGNIRNITLRGRSTADKAAISRETLQQVASISTLEWLDLSFSDVSDDALEPLKRLRSLRGLDLSFTNATGKALGMVSTLPDLLSLRMEACKVSDDDLKALANMPQLVNLYLGGTQVTDAGLPRIGKLPELVLLDLCDCAITDKGLRSLGHFKQLQHLWLSKTIRYGENDRSQLTDGAVEYLSTLKTLIDLQIADSQLTDDGLSRLREALPKTNISTTRTGTTYLLKSKP